MWRRLLETLSETNLWAFACYTVSVYFWESVQVSCFLRGLVQFAAFCKVFRVLVDLGPVPEFIYRSFSAWKQAKYARFWKRSFSPRDKRGSETWVVFGSFLACFRPHQYARFGGENENYPARVFSMKTSHVYWHNLQIFSLIFADFQIFLFSSPKRWISHM